MVKVLVVIGIIGILAALVIVAVNPSRQFAQARNTQRESNVATILNAIGQNIADNKGIFTCSSHSLPASPDGTWGNGEEKIGTDDANLDCLLNTYITAEQIPYDPEVTTPAAGKDDTKYTLEVDDVGHFRVCAPNHDEDPIPGSTEYCLTR